MARLATLKFKRTERTYKISFYLFKDTHTERNKKHKERISRNEK